RRRPPPEPRDGRHAPGRGRGGGHDPPRRPGRGRPARDGRRLAARRPARLGGARPHHAPPHHGRPALRSVGPSVRRPPPPASLTMSAAASARERVLAAVPALEGLLARGAAGDEVRSDALAAGDDAQAWILWFILRPDCPSSRPRSRVCGRTRSTTRSCAATPTTAPC